MIRAALFALGMTLVFTVGCPDNNVPPEDSAPNDANQAPAKPVEPPKPSPPKNPIVAESLKWSAEEALANLPDPDLSLSAAVRLVHLSDVDAEGIPEPLPVEAAIRLACIRLSDWSYAIGVRDAADERLLHDPLLIDAEGQVTRPGHDEGDQERETFALRVSESPNVFPHVLIGERSVRGVQQDEQRIVLRSPRGLRFRVAREDGFDHLILVRPTSAKLEFIEEEPGKEGAADDGRQREGGGGQDDAQRPASQPGEQSDAGKPESGERDDKTPARSPEAAGRSERTEGEAAPSGENAGPEPGGGGGAATPASDGAEVEVARYKWDPFELMFMGPARDYLPGSQEQIFEMELEQSTWLLPVGGIIGKPDPAKRKEDDEREPF